MYGQTGSGKTVAALWHLSQRSYTNRPWVIFDFKGDEHIASVPHTDELQPGAFIPKHAGLYVTRPVPEHDDERVELMMWDIWKREKIGIYTDEGYMIGRKNSAFKALLTQGRSKSIPMITLSQRPVWMTRFAISEADFHQVFFLSDEADRDVVQRFIPHEMEERLPRYHSYYYDVANDHFLGLKPVPEPATILETFEERLKRTMRFL
jgi:hypothetical protein